ncbi:MAG TPA: GtrA family protein [Pseudoxanthomonas sp.]|nr:GtrA family protein [Pseudoxanthomonas sp.]
MWRTATLYAVFAALSIAVNIGTQALCMAFYRGPGAVLVSIAAGTATGLAGKYLLDKRWIFRHVSRDRVHEARTFALYTAMGLATTAVFWGTELAFHLVFGSDALRYLGGVLGLVAGYALKYRLDRRYVFTGS